MSIKKGIRSSYFGVGRSRSLLVLSIFLSTFIAVTCSPKHENIPQIADSVAIPFQESSKSMLYCYSGSKLLFKLNSDFSHKDLLDTAKMLVVPVRLQIFDTSNSKRITKVLSDSGTVANTLEHFFIWGNVYIKNQDGLIIRSQSLWWNKKSHNVGSDDFVEIQTPEGDILRGKGLDATETFSTWSLRSNVSGKFPNFKKRVETNEF